VLSKVSFPDMDTEPVMGEADAMAVAANRTREVMQEAMRKGRSPRI
jgi:hypothetical protein